jgi:hypothetical protein
MGFARSEKFQMTVIPLFRSGLIAAGTRFVPQYPPGNYFLHAGKASRLYGK